MDKNGIDLVSMKQCGKVKCDRVKRNNKITFRFYYFRVYKKVGAWDGA